MFVISYGSGKVRSGTLLSRPSFSQRYQQDPHCDLTDGMSACEGECGFWDQSGKAGKTGHQMVCFDERFSMLLTFATQAISAQKLPEDGKV